MKAPIAQSDALPGKAQGCAIGAFIGVNCQKRLKNSPDCRWVMINRQVGRLNNPTKANGYVCISNLRQEM
jgi:hypothetical protein